MNRKRTNAFIAMMMLGLFIASQTFIWSCRHVHMVNGVMLTHSHPFHSTHSHTDSDTISLHFITSLLYLEPTVQEMPEPLVTDLEMLADEPLMAHPEVGSVTPPSLRAPPM